MGIYELSAVRQQYNGRFALSIDQLTIQQGEIFAIVGPSGAGKSTLLRLLNFLEMPASGEIIYRTQINADERRFNQGHIPLEARQRITMVFQRPFLLNRSVFANLHYPLALRGQKPDSAELHGWLAKLGLAHVAHQSALKLSAGEAQRVALARALVIRPTVLLLDEPTANLDPYNVGLIEGIVRQVNAEQGTTVVLVTHNIFQARRLAHRTALLWNGELVEVAETSEFFERPKMEKTAVFVRGELVY